MTTNEIKALEPFPSDYLKRAENDEVSKGYVIGYSRSFFTLWLVSYHPRRFEDKRWQQTFIQNLIQLPASEEDTVHEMFPNLEIDLGLRGDYWHTIKADLEVFRFGKYKGTRIDECTDGGYLKWYINSMDYSYKSSSTIALIVATRLYQLGYSYIVNGEEADYVVGTYGGYWISPISKEHRAKVREAFENGTLEMLFSGRSMCRIFDTEYEQYGLDTNKDYCCCTSDTITYIFEGKFYPATYYAGEYYLPILNGKAKRVKGKNVRVLSYEKLGASVVLVKEFAVEDKPKEAVVEA